MAHGLRDASRPACPGCRGGPGFSRARSGCYHRTVMSAARNIAIAAPRRRTLSSLVDLHESNYHRLLRLVPDLRCFEGTVVSRVAGALDLYLTVHPAAALHHDAHPDVPLRRRVSAECGNRGVSRRARRGARQLQPETAAKPEPGVEPWPDAGPRQEVAHQPFPAEMARVLPPAGGICSCSLPVTASRRHCPWKPLRFHG